MSTALAPMEFRAVSGTDLKMSRLVMGAMTFGGQVAATEAQTMVDIALDAGVTVFDTAAQYTKGESERLLGLALGPRRKDVVLATKVHPSAGGLTPNSIGKAIDGSLQRLGTDWIDIYYLHQPDWQTPIEETLGFMNDLVQTGKVRFIGLSNYPAWKICDIRARSAARGWQVPSISQQMYSLVARRIDEEYAAFANEAQMFDVVYNPLAGGLLTGKHRPSEDAAPGTRFSQESYRTRYWNDQQFGAVQTLRALAEKNGMTLIQLAFRWLLTRPLVDAVLLGASSVDHLRTNLVAALDADRALSPEIEVACDEVWADLRGIAPAYNR
jgi:aryl-alcohol dehydrogenase-like predicted oxidoreductase